MLILFHLQHGGDDEVVITAIRVARSRKRETREAGRPKRPGAAAHPHSSPKALAHSTNRRIRRLPGGIYSCTTRADRRWLVPNLHDLNRGRDHESRHRYPCAGPSGSPFGGASGTPELPPRTRYRFVPQCLISGCVLILRARADVGAYPAAISAWTISARVRSRPPAGLDRCRMGQHRRMLTSWSMQASLRPDRLPALEPAECEARVTRAA